MELHTPVLSGNQQLHSMEGHGHAIPETLNDENIEALSIVAVQASLCPSWSNAKVSTGSAKAPSLNATQEESTKSGSTQQSRKSSVRPRRPSPSSKRSRHRRSQRLSQTTSGAARRRRSSRNRRSRELGLAQKRNTTKARRYFIHYAKQQEEKNYNEAREVLVQTGTNTGDPDEA
ncbi:hypothetical protein KIN20_025078 [Parelaphostrongylus tenuis]|uniref:Uncharacterized protein n=1 Tax=Parelaphostrongylus tenuis TaxID=148309 RepID=A0AAD5MUM3_PARTN|nr:hypothetical protein KIN20_025078 [Parelaphostrongylus tenuis]